MKPTPPALPALPVIGHAIEFAKNRNGLLRRGYESLGPVFSIKLGPKPAAVLIGPDYHQTFFMETDKSLRMDYAYKFLAAMFGEIAFTAPPETYIEQRPVLHEPFKGSKMIQYVGVMQQEVQAWLDSLGAAGELELVGQITALVQNVAAHALMGQEFHQHMGPAFWDLYLDLGKSLDPLLPPDWPLPKFRRRDRAKQKLRAILQPIIAERRLHPGRYDDFLQEFVNTRFKDGREVSDEVIIGLILALMFAGHETTAGQAAWSIIQLLQNPEYLALVSQELTLSLPYGRPIDARTLPALNHVAWAVRETGRMYPSADLLLRHVTEGLDVSEYHIPKGWLVLVAAGIAHYLPELFAEPERYDPLRYAPGREEDRQHRFAMIGFGGGIHKCTGMNFANNEMMVIIALLFQQFDLELVTKKPGIQYDLGASRPQKTILRYRRKDQPQAVPPDVMAAALAAGCPHVAALAQDSSSELSN